MVAYKSKYVEYLPRKTYITVDISRMLYEPWNNHIFFQWTEYNLKVFIQQHLKEKYRAVCNKYFFKNWRVAEGFFGTEKWQHIDFSLLDKNSNWADSIEPIQF